MIISKYEPLRTFDVLSSPEGYIRLQQNVAVFRLCDRWARYVLPLEIMLNENELLVNI